MATSDEVIAYFDTFLVALKEAGAKEKKQQKEWKKDEKKTDTKAINSGNSPNSATRIIDDDAEKLISSLSLEESKKFAKNKIEELLKKYNPDLEKIKPL